MQAILFDDQDHPIFDEMFYSVGGGFIASARQLEQPAENDMIARPVIGRYGFESAADLLQLTQKHQCSIADIILDNELERRTQAEIDTELDRVWEVMSMCIDRGLTISGTLPGGLNVSRRAPMLYQKLLEAPLANEREQLFDWLNVYAMAVNEENASGGRVVTAPTQWRRRDYPVRPAALLY